MTTPLPCWGLVIPPMVTLKSPGPAVDVETEAAMRIDAIRTCLMAVPPVDECDNPGAPLQCLCHCTQYCLVRHMGHAPGAPPAELSRGPTPAPHSAMT